MPKQNVCFHCLKPLLSDTHAVTENQQLNTHLLKRKTVLLFFANANMAFHSGLSVTL